jgi:Amt family ammonium transporter
LAASGEANRVAISHVFLTTNLAACAGGFASLVTSWIRYKKPLLSLTLNGVLAGLVGITAGCDLVSPIGAIIIGLVCGSAMIFSVEFIDRVLKIDDPVGASSVHGVCGLIGTVLTGFLATDSGLLYGFGGGFLAAQCVGALAVGAWAFAAGYVVFKVLNVCFKLRVAKRIEEEGLDIYEHGETSYN